MNVWHLVFRADSLTYTVAKALSWGGHDVSVWVVDPEQDRDFPDGIQKRLRDTLRVSIVSRDESKVPPVIDRLIVQVFPRPMESIREIAPLATRARKIALVTAGDRSRPWRDAMKMQCYEARRFAPYADKVDRVLYKDGFYRRDLIGLFKNRYAVGFDVHSQFLHDEALFRAMHARDWEPATVRPILANFLGCRDPDARQRVLDLVRPYFFPASDTSRSIATAKQMYWHEYPDAAPVGLEPLEFADILSRSDFSLCPRGYSLVTHHPIEALLRGSIPVLATNETDLYGLDLEDGVNCVAVPDGDWTSAMHRLASMEEGEIVAMRTRIYSQLDDRLDYDSLSKRMRARFGVADR
jgi:hypothetical protein